MTILLDANVRGRQPPQRCPPNGSAHLGSMPVHGYTTRLASHADDAVCQRAVGARHGCIDGEGIEPSLDLGQAPDAQAPCRGVTSEMDLSLIHISEPTRR